jgi:metal-responsive CopG/Arc/MetJ family transcriptional regulator
MRALIDIPDDQVEALAEMAKNEKVSRAELIRRAIADLVASRTAISKSAAFGLWGAKEDGLAYEDRIRSEW